MLRKLKFAAASIAASIVAAVALWVAQPLLAPVVARAQAVAGYYLTNGQILIGVTGGGPAAATLTGTTGQVTVTNGAGTITMSQPLAIIVGPYASSNLAVLSPAASGYITYNNTIGAICTSTGTGPGAWIFPRSSATNSTLIPCY